MSQVRPIPAEVEAALRDIEHAGDLSQALGILLDACGALEGTERALVLMLHGDTLRGTAGKEWEPDAVQEVLIGVDDEGDPLAAAFRKKEPCAFHLPDATGVVREGRYILLPLRGERAEPFGALLIGPDDRGIEAFAGAVSLLGALGPVLEKVADLHGPGESAADVARERDLLKAAIDALPDPVFITDAHNAVLLHNRRAEALFVSAPDDNDGRRRAVEINNLFFSSFLTQAAIGGGASTARELNLVNPSDGGDLLFEALITAGPVELAGEGGTVSVLRDVTDLRHATTELELQFKRLRQVESKSRRERDRLNMILENVGDPILVTDDQSNIIMMNREAERLFDSPSEDDTHVTRRSEVRTNGMKFSSFISDFALNAEFTRVAHFSLTDPETGLEFPAEAVSGKVLNERSEVAVIVSILHDLTEVEENKRLAAELARVNEGLEDRIRAATRQLEERNRELEAQSRELEQSYQLQSQFLASMSHELRTPINSLLGYTALLRDRIYGEMTPSQEEAMERMYLASHHLLELVNDILDLAKIESGKMPVYVDRVQVADLIREVSETVEPMVQRKALALEIEISPDLPAIETDGTKVKQVILNLLSNAVKFTKEGHVRVHADVSTGESGGCESGVTISVSDTGIGIEEEDVGKIFDDFRQIDESVTREYGGTGLGLSITKKLLHLLGGTIRVVSAPGKGSTFTVCLPLRSEGIDAKDGGMRKNGNPRT